MGTKQVFLFQFHEMGIVLLIYLVGVIVKKNHLRCCFWKVFSKPNACYSHCYMKPVS